MQAFRVTLKPLSAFATPLKGDTLFGQLCWAIRNRFGEDRLNHLLQDYAGNRPFAVVSDAFPEGYWPMPSLPAVFFTPPINKQAHRKRRWLPEAALQRPLQNWMQLAQTDVGAGRSGVSDLTEKRPQTHNIVDRRGLRQNQDDFAAYSAEREWFDPGLNWVVCLLLDTTRWSEDECRRCLQDIGTFGYGKDASIGLGKFEVLGSRLGELPQQIGANACLTLAPSAPQGLNFDSERSYYHPFVRFGRHGDRAAHRQGGAFKNPVLMAQTGAVFGVEPPATGFIGQGLGGNGELSKTLAAAVQQGYAPVIGIAF